jgi:hypothetical protein
MNQMMVRILVQAHEHDMQVKAARAQLDARAKAATRSSSTGTPAGIRKWTSSLVSSLVAVVR